MGLYSLINIRGIAPLLWLEGKSHPIFLSSRTRIARNIQGLAFPHLARVEELSRVVEIVEGVWRENNFPYLLFFPLMLLSPSEKNLLAELHLISREFARAETEGRALLISPDASLSVMLNEEDHIRISALGRGDELEWAMRRAYKLEEIWSGKIDFAYSPSKGFLTTSPSNTGTGLRLSVIAHLPALNLLKGREFIEEQLLPDMEIRGLLGEGSTPLGFFFQISTKKTLGVTAEKSLREMVSTMRIIEERETSERDKLFKREAFIDEIEDAYAQLRSATSLSTYSATQLLSLLRLASARGIIPIPLDIIDLLLFLIRPTAIQFLKGQKMKIEERDKERAKLIKETLKI